MPELPWTRFVAMGDSLTEGVGDPVRGSLRGWADRLVVTLREVDPRLAYWNLARRSLRTAEVRDEQLERTLEIEPDLVSVMSGMNDLMAPDFESERYRADLVSVVAPVSGTGATIVMGTFPREMPILRLLPRAKEQKYKHRLLAASDMVRLVAAEYDAVCVETPAGWRYGMSECSVDGCHPNARGHLHIAELTLRALCERAGMPAPRMARDGAAWVKTSAGHLRWLVSEGYLRRPPPVIAWRRQT